MPFIPDTAPVAGLLRRWLDTNRPEFSWVADVVDRANSQLGDRDAAIGPSHFMRSDLDDEWVDLIWSHSILPYIEEQLFGEEDRLAEFRPHLGGAAWRGTATRLSPLLVDLYCDDPKAAEIAFLNQGIDFDSHGDDDDQVVLSVEARCPDLNDFVSIHFMVHDHDDLRGALKPDSRGASWRGSAQALRERLAMEAPQ